MKKIVVLAILLFINTYSHAKGYAYGRYYNYTQDTGYFGSTLMFVYANYGDTVTLFAHDDDDMSNPGLSLPWLLNGVATSTSTADLYNDSIQIVVSQPDIYAIQSSTAFFIQFKICMPPNNAPLVPIILASSSTTNFCTGLHTYFNITYLQTCNNNYVWTLPVGIVQVNPGPDSYNIAVDVTSAFSGDDSISVVAVNSIGTSPPAKMRLQCITTGISEQTAQTFSVYPNPATDFVLIKTNIKNPVPLQIINKLGEILFENKNVVQQINVPVKNFAKGIYTIKTGNVVQRFLKL